MSEDNTESEALPEDTMPVDETPPSENIDGDSEETADEQNSDPFPEETPTTIRREASTYINRLSEVGVEVTQITHQHRQPEQPEVDQDEQDGEGAEDTQEENEPELDSIGLQCKYNNSTFFVILPLDEPYNIFQADYDLLEDMVFASPSDHLGGEFEALKPEKRWEAYQNVRDGFEMEQVLGLCQSNRGVPVPTLEAWFSLLRTSSDKFIVESTRLQYEFVGGVAQRRSFDSPTEVGTQELYETVTQILALRNGIQDILGSTYLLNGVTIPENFQTLHQDVTEDKTDMPRRSGHIGFQ